MKITLSRLSNSVLGTLASQAIMSSNKPQNTVVVEHPLLLALVKEEKDYVSVFGKQTFSGMGKTLVKADTLCDSAFIGYKTLLTGFIKLPGFQYQQDAVDIFSIFQKRGLDIYTYSYADQITEMDKLISDLDEPTVLVKMEHLHLTQHFLSLKNAQTDLKTIYSEQLAANSSLRLVLSASSTRRKLEGALRNYLAVVEGMKDINGWKELHAELNELAKSIRNSKLGPRNETETTTETPS